MKQFVTVRGYTIAVHARSGAQAEWYRTEFSKRTDEQLAALAAESETDTLHQVAQNAIQARNIEALQRRSAFYIV